MAQRVRYRFAVLDLELAKPDFPLNLGQIAGAIKTGLGDYWGEVGSFIVAPFVRVLSMEKVGSRRFLAVARYPRDYEVHVLSTCSLLWTIADVVAAVRLRVIVGNPKNSQNACTLLRQSMALFL